MPASGAAAEGAGPDHPPRAGGRRSGGAGDRLCVALSIVIPLIECCSIVVPLATMFSITSDPLVIPAVSISDTRIVSLPWPSSLCGGITLARRPYTLPRASLFLVTHPPPLTTWNNFTFSSSLTLADNAYHYWNYYLRPNSNFTTEVCMYPNSTGGTFYLIKGRNNFQKWVNVPSSSDEALAFFSITSFPCSARSKHRYSFLVQAEDEYYFVYYGKRSHSIIDSMSLLLDVTISIDRLQYSVGDVRTAPRCLTSYSRCTVPLTYGNGLNYKALIFGSMRFNRNWAQTSDFSLHCAYSVWTFAVAGIVPYILVNVIFCCTFGVVVGVILAREKKERSNSTPVPTVQQRAPRIELRHNIRSFPKAQDRNPVTLYGKQDLTAVAPPTYGESLDYPSIANSKLCEEFPPSYECATNKV